MSMGHSLNAQLIHQRFGRDSHHCIIQMYKLGIYTGLPNYITKLSHPCCTCIVYKGYGLPLHPNVSTENLYPGNCFHMDFSFSNRVSSQKFTSEIIIFYATTINIFVYHTRSKQPPLQLIKKFLHLYYHRGYKNSIFQVGEGGEFSILSDFMQL